MAPRESSKREAQARYRARNQEDLRRKAREGMARLRAQLQQSETNTSQARKTAREEAARYRSKNRALLAQKALVRRARNAIDRMGYEQWAAKYKKRHSAPIPAILEAEYCGPRPLAGPSKHPAQLNRLDANTTQACAPSSDLSTLGTDDAFSSHGDACNGERRAECEDYGAKIKVWRPTASGVGKGRKLVSP
ncbi:hypothetical protein B0H14DRAFT_2587295 [Mycena olivaceomarginata]|nr:hypothetical protein B0H14DRAFT_2587295 [Mycena olivaceomarginata]